MPLSSLPILSLADDAASFSKSIGDSFRTFGFAMVKDHGIDASLIDRAWQAPLRPLRAIAGTGTNAAEGA